MINCPVCDTLVAEPTFKAHLEQTHTFELLQRLKNESDRAVQQIRATGLHIARTGGLIADLEISGELWSR